MKMLIGIYILIGVSLASLAVFTHIYVYAATTTDTIIVNLEVTEGTTTSGPGDPDDLEITNVSVISTDTTATITWNTNLVAFSEFSWGLTTGHELGTIIESESSRSHSVNLIGLTPGTTYYFKIFAYEDGDSDNTDTETGQFDTLDEDVTPPATPFPFTATYDPSDHDIDLSWVNPSDPDFDVVRIMKRDDFFPLDEEDGVFVYEGPLEFFEDTNIDWGTTYYYSLFARDLSGNWSAPSVDDATVPPEGERELDCDPLIENCDPFADLPPGPVPPGLDDVVFKFTQSDRGTTFFSDGATVFVNGLLDLKTHVDYLDLPEVLKTIGVTLRHPKDPNKIFNFLLKIDTNKEEYAAIVAPLVEGGVYDMSITVLDHKNQKIKVLEGRLDVDGTDLQIPLFLKKFITPFGQGLGILAGITQTIAMTTNAKSLFDILLMLIRGFWTLLSFLGIRRKSKPWGTVYDSVTKRPLDPAYVTISKDGEDVNSAITDLDGRYGFLLPEGEYTMTANKTHYKFPSEKLIGKEKDELYENLYFGEHLVSREGEIINKNIPLDPIDFDWNEFVKNKKGLFILNSKREKIKNTIFNSLFWLGFAFSLFAIFISPTVYNWIILTSYVLIFVFQTLWSYKHKAIQIIDSESDEPLPFAIIRVYLAQLNQQVKTIVSDEMGRFYVLLTPGEYYFTVEEKMLDGSYRKVYTSDIMDLKSGVLKDNIKIGNAHLATI